MKEVVLALHIIFIVTWFAGLFYMVRLFVYQAELKDKTEEERRILGPQYQLMAQRLWYIITWPSMILTLILGPILLYITPVYLKMGFMHIKLAFVAGLIIYHFVCHRYFLQFGKGTNTKSSGFFRLWNEVATLFLVAIVFLIIMKDRISWLWGTLSFFGVAILLMIGIKVYKKLREKKQS